MGITEEDRAVFDTYGSRRHLLVMNKMDLPESRTFDACSLPLPTTSRLPLRRG